LKKLRKGAIALYAFNRGETFEVAQPKFEMLSHQDQGRLMEAVRQVLVALVQAGLDGAMVDYVRATFDLMESE